MTAHQRVIRDDSHYALRQPWILSVALAALVTVVFIVNAFQSSADLVDQAPAPAFSRLGLLPRFVDDGQVYRLWTAALLHANVWSLIATVITLVVVGSEVESRWGARRYIVTLATVGLGAGTAVLYFEPAVERFVTGNGAAMGIMGAALVVAHRARFRIWALLLVAAFNIAIYLTVSNESSLWAAIGGLVSGAIIATLLIMAPRDHGRVRWQFMALGIFFALLCVLVVLHMTLFS